MLTDLTDGELISLFIKQKNENAFEVLVRRYYTKLYNRFKLRLGDSHLAHDFSQKLWMRVISHLADYQDNNKFEHFLNTIATNLLKDEWRSRSKKDEISADDEFGEFQIDRQLNTKQGSPSIEDQLNYKQASEYLINELIPALPCDQRLVFLLKHESEYWDEKQPLQWQHVAELNKLDTLQAYKLFESGRDKLMINTSHSEMLSSLSCEEQLVFLLWTQAQRPDKSRQYTEQYFANLLNIPVNTFKTKYRASQKKLAEGLKLWR